MKTSLGENLARQTVFRRYVDSLDGREPFLFVRMDITNKCNMRCRMCFYPAEAAANPPAVFMSPELFSRIARQIFPRAIAVQLSCMYEPLLSPHIAPILEELGRYDVPICGLVTNGMLLNAKVAEALVRSRVKYIHISIDGTDRSTFESIRVGGDFDRVVGNVKTLRDVKRSAGSQSPGIHLNFVLMRSNVHQVADFVDMASDLGASVIEFVHIQPRSRDNPEYLGNHLDLWLPEQERARARARERGIRAFFRPDRISAADSASTSNTACQPPERMRCRAPWQVVHIRPEGTVYPCVHRASGSDPFGDLNHQDFADIWNGLPYLRLRRDLDRGLRPGRCADCPTFSEYDFEVLEKLE